jgi:tyrosyl-tRNA synthetase
VRDFHTAADADAAGESWAKQFQRREVAEDVPVVKISLGADGLIDVLGGLGGAIRMAKLLQLAGLAASAGEATRKLAENAVSVNGEKLSSRMVEKPSLGDSPILRLGKKSVRIQWVE